MSEELTNDSHISKLRDDDARRRIATPATASEDTALLDFAERYLGTIARFELVEVYHRIHGNLLAKGDNIRTAIRAAMKEKP